MNAHADTFTKCLEYCSLLEGYIAVTYQDGNNAANDNANCYPYYSFTGYSTGGPSNVYSGVAIDGASIGAVGSEDLCGEGSASLNQNVFGPDTFGTCYYIGYGQYLTPKPTLFATDMTSLEGCLTYCTIYDTCVAVDWLGPHTQGVRDVANCIPMAGMGSVSPEAPSTYQYAVATNCLGAP